MTSATVGRMERPTSLPESSLERNIGVDRARNGRGRVERADRRCRVRGRDRARGLGRMGGAQPVLPDRDDAPFCECAESADADFIVTLNPSDFPQSRLKSRSEDIQINPKPEKPLNNEPHISPLRPCPRRWRYDHDHSWHRRCGRLAHGEFRRPSPNDGYPSICRAIPPVHQIARTAPQCPDGEIQAERRDWPQLELERGRPVARHGDSAR